MIKTAWLVLNYSCNNSCNYCYATSVNQQNVFMSIGYAKSVLKELARISVLECLLIGGEPTLHPSVCEIIAYGSSLGLQMKMVSNGRLLSGKDFLQELISCGIKHISVSLESPREEDHNLISGVNCFKETISGIMNCIKSGVSINTVTTINKYNKESLTEVAKLSHSLGVKNILFNYGVPTVISRTGDDEGLFMSPDRLAVSAVHTYSCLKNEGIKVRFFGTIPICVYGDKVEEMIKGGYISGSSNCHMFRGQGIVFEPSGKIIPCTHFVNTELLQGIDKEGRFVFQNRMNKVWMDDLGAVRQFQNLLWRYPSKECSECKIWGRCIGGCPLLWRVFDPKKYTRKFR